MNFQRVLQAIVLLALLFALVLAGQALVRDAGKESDPTPTMESTPDSLQPVVFTPAPNIDSTPVPTETITATQTAALTETIGATITITETAPATTTSITISTDTQQAPPSATRTATNRSITQPSTQTATVQSTVASTNTQIVAPSQTPMPSATQTNTSLPSLTPRANTATSTATPSVTPVQPSPTPSRRVTNTITPFPTLTPSNTPFPASARLGDGPDLLNILLLGTDSRPNEPSMRTDVMVIVSINRTTNSVNMLSIPRDLYVPIPGNGENRISFAVFFGQRNGAIEPGIELLKDTIYNNFGITIDHWALIDFVGFRQVIDSIGGVDILVDCAFEDYRLISSDLDPDIESNYELYQLETGLYHMDGFEALWYVRSRVTTSDFDRNRRQQMMLRAIWSSFRVLDRWSEIPDLWNALESSIQTDMTLDDILFLMPIAVSLDYDLIESHFIGVGDVEPYTTPAGASVLRLIPARAAVVVDAFLSPPTSNRLYQEHPRIELVNQTGHVDMDLVAAERLAWEGFVPVVNEATAGYVAAETTIYDFTGVTKGSSLTVLQRVLNVPLSNVVYIPDPDREVDYRIILGENYDSCTYAPWERIPQVN